MYIFMKIINSENILFKIKIYLFPKKIFFSPINNQKYIYLSFYFFIEIKKVENIELNH